MFTTQLVQIYEEDQRLGSQRQSSNSVALEGVTLAADQTIVADGTGNFVAVDMTPAAQTFMAAVSVAAERTVLGLGSAALLAADTDVTLAANSDANIATQKAVKTYVDNTVTGVLKFKGTTDCSANPNYPVAAKGDAYLVTVAGKIGGASGVSVDVGDVYAASAANAGGTQAAVGTSWFVLEHNLVGALLAANNLSDLASAATARTNLGLVAVASSGSATDLTAGTLPAGRMPALTGDVTTVAGAVAATIAAGAVTLAKQANLAANSIIGNNTGAPATPLALTVAQVKALLAIATGDVSGLGTMATQAANAVAITGGTLAGLTGFAIRNAGTGAFDMTVAYNGTLTAGRTLTWNLNDAARAVSLSGDLTTGGAVTFSGAFAFTGTLTAATTVTFPTTGTLATLAGTETLSSKTLTAPKVTITTFAGLPSAASNSGALAFASDVGVNGTLLRSNGTRWLPVAGRIVLVNQAASGNISNVETIVMQTLIPAGLMAAGDVLSATYGLAKSGATDGCNFAFRLGTAGTIADTNLATANTGALAAANLNGSGYLEWQIVSVTTTQRLGAQGPQGHFSAVSANATQAAVTISSVTSNALWASLSIVSTGATNTTKLQNGRIELITG